MVIITYYVNLQVFSLLAALQTFICSRHNTEEHYLFRKSTRFSTQLFLRAEQVAAFLAKGLTGRKKYP